MQELDKAAMGRRIRQIRLHGGYRQWELAKKLGTTQSAIHKYEHGVVPEPRRLIELARIGGTSVEWILTGSHWENGSSEQRRLTPELLQTAVLLREVEDREAVDQALRILRDAVRAASADRGSETVENTSARDQTSQTLKVLRAARRIQDAVLRRVLLDARGRLAGSPALGDDKGTGKGGPPTSRR